MEDRVHLVALRQGQILFVPQHFPFCLLLPFFSDCLLLEHIWQFPELADADEQGISAVSHQDLSFGFVGQLVQLQQDFLLALLVHLQSDFLVKVALDDQETGFAGVIRHDWETVLHFGFGCKLLHVEVFGIEVAEVEDVFGVFAQDFHFFLCQAYQWLVFQEKWQNLVHGHQLV